MSEIQHTPTPWAYSKEENGYWVRFLSENGHILAKLETFDSPHEANAAHIVHCVNTYEEREALLKEMGESLGKIDKLQDLWLPTTHFLPEHEGEIQALQRMSEQIKSTLEKYKSHTS